MSMAARLMALLLFVQSPVAYALNCIGHDVAERSPAASQPAAHYGIDHEEAQPERMSSDCHESLTAKALPDQATNGHASGDHVNESPCCGDDCQCLITASIVPPAGASCSLSSGSAVAEDAIDALRLTALQVPTPPPNA